MFLHTSDNKPYCDLKLDLVKKPVLGDDKYAKLLEGAQKILTNYKPAGSNRRFPVNAEQSGVAVLLTRVQKKLARQPWQTSLGLELSQLALS